MSLNKVTGEMFQYQTPATLNQATPVQDTWYTLLDVKDARLYAAACNIEDANETVDVELTVDGVPYVVNPEVLVHSTTYLLHVTMDAITRTITLGLDSAANYNRYKTFQVEGHTMLIRLRQTSNAGACGNLTAIAQYGVLKRA